MQNAQTAIAHPIPEACRMLGIGRTLMYEMLDRGDLRSIRLGSRRLIPTSELQRIVTERMAVQS